jgi:uncharacterized cupin superfamily protein
MSPQARVHSSTLQPRSWDPFDAGEVDWLRREDDGDRLLMAGVWRVTPDEVPERTSIEFPHDETLYVIEGEMRVEVEDGPVLELKAGDFASFDRGTKVLWTILAPVREFFVYSGSRSSGD